MAICNVTGSSLARSDDSPGNVLKRSEFDVAVLEAGDSVLADLEQFRESHLREVVGFTKAPSPRRTTVTRSWRRRGTS
jgi:hypothetical protein